jgi:hypothetical protein
MSGRITIGTVPRGPTGESTLATAMLLAFRCPEHGPGDPPCGRCLLIAAAWMDAIEGDHAATPAVIRDRCAASVARRLK